MRRSSFIAPLLLIVTGLLFLARNLYPNLPLMDYIARYWPWILVLWGGLRVAEIVLWKAQDRPLPSTGITGGEWLLVALLCVVGAGIHAAHGFGASWPGQIRINGMDFLGQPFDYPVQAQRESSKTPHILLADFRGDVRVTGSDSSLVKVTGHKTVRSMDQNEADQISKLTLLEITGEGSELEIRTRDGKANDARRVFYNLEISVPKGAQMEVRGQNGDLDVADLAGIVFVSERGDARIRNIDGPSRITVRRGDVQVEAARLAGQIDVSGGDVEASNVTGALKISARSGDVKVNGATGPIDVNVTRGDLQLRPGPSTNAIRAQTRSGDISLAMPAGAQFSMEATTSNGDVTTDFSELKAEASGRRGTLRGSIGKGPAIELQTNRGDVSVHKASGTVSTEVQTRSDSGKSGGALEKLDQ